MIFQNINLKKELVKKRDYQNELLDKFLDVFNQGKKRDDEVLHRLRTSEGNVGDPKLNVTENRVFNRETIQKICIRYRLRFLPSKHFKADFPYEAILEINKIEKELQTKIENFRIIAPSKAFDLENINQDPLLFAQITEDKFYLIHQWGNELKWYRRIFTWPLQNFKTYFFSLWFIAALFVFAIPSSVMHQMSRDSEFFLRAWLTVHCFIAFMGFTFGAALTFEKTFSSANWESKYYNW